MMTCNNSRKNVLVRVTIGIGDDIHNSNAAALDVSLGFISFSITFLYLLLSFQSRGYEKRLRRKP